jgi:hypothetical protein
VVQEWLVTNTIRTTPDQNRMRRMADGRLHPSASSRGGEAAAAALPSRLIARSP